MSKFYKVPKPPRKRSKHEDLLVDIALAALCLVAGLMFAPAIEVLIEMTMNGGW